MGSELKTAGAPGGAPTVKCLEHPVADGYAILAIRAGGSRPKQ